ncbi:MAG: hypothetical protein HY670_04865 [Chloroflexi bacterium]|nr:hypothetical protein [Chloroflexota bacterium]
MAEKDVRLEEIPLDSPRLRDFVRFPWQLYKGDPCWTPPLKGDLLGSRLLGLPGLLTSRHPYHRHAPDIALRYLAVPFSRDARAIRGFVYKSAHLVDAMTGLVSPDVVVRLYEGIALPG